MPQSLNKVTKKITKKKGRITGLHEHSRDAKKLRKAGLREERVHRLAVTKAKQEEAYVQRIAFFQAALRDLESAHPVSAQGTDPAPSTSLSTSTAEATSTETATDDDTLPDALPAPSLSSSSLISSARLQSLVETFLAQSSSAHPSSRSYGGRQALPFAVNRPARPKTGAEERAAARREALEREYDAGFWMPELRTADGRESLRRWRGDWGALGQLTFIRVDRRGAVKESAFPPRGSV